MRWWWLSVLVLVLSGVAFAFQGSERTDDDDCPCLPMDQCPRIYGQSAMDVRELGFIKPCRQYGTVRCCGVTIRIEHEKDEDRQVISRPIRLRSSALKRDSSTNKGQEDLQAAATQTNEATQEVSETPSSTTKIRPLLKFRRRKVEPSLRSVANESQVAIDTPVEDQKQPEVQQSPVPAPPRLKGLTLPRTLRKPLPSPPAEIVNVTEKAVPEEATPTPSPVVSLLPKSRPGVSPIFKLRRPGGLKVGIQVESALPTTVDVLTRGEKVRGISANRKDSSKTVIELDINLPKSNDTRFTQISQAQNEPTPIDKPVVLPRPRPVIRKRPTNKASELIGLGTSTESVVLEPVTPAPTETTTPRLRRPIRPVLRRRPVTPAPVVDSAVELATPVAVSTLFEPTSAPYNPAPYTSAPYIPAPYTPAPYTPAPARYYPKPESTTVPERRPKYKLRRTTTTTTEPYEQTTAKLVEYELSSTTEIPTTSTTTTVAPDTTQAPVAPPAPELTYERYPAQHEVNHQIQPELPQTGGANYDADHEEPIKIQIQSAVVPPAHQSHYYIGGSQPDERIVTISQSTPQPQVVEDIQIHYDSYANPDNEPGQHESQPRPKVHNPSYEHDQEEPRQPVVVTSTYARIRHGDGHRPEDYQRPAPTYYAQPTQRPPGAKPQRRFQAPNRFTFSEDDESYAHETQEVIHHTPEWEKAENYDLVVDKEAKKSQPAPSYHQNPPNAASYVYTRKPTPQRYEEDTYSHSLHTDIDDYVDEYEEFQEESRVTAEYVKPDEALDSKSGDEDSYVTKPKRKRVRVFQKPVQVAQPDPTPLQPTTNPQHVDNRAQILNRKRFQAKLPPLSQRKSMQRVKAEKEKPTLVYPDTSEHLESPATSTPLPRRKKISQQRYPSVITAEVVSSPAPVPTTSYTEYYNHQIPPTEPTTEPTTSTTPIPPPNSSAVPDTPTTTIVDIQAARNKEPANYEASVKPTQFQFRQPQRSSYEIRRPVQKVYNEVHAKVEEEEEETSQQLPTRPTIVSINASPDSIKTKEEGQVSKEVNPSVFLDIVADRGQLNHTEKHEAQNSEVLIESPQAAQVESQPQTFSEFHIFPSQNSISLVEQPTPFDSHLSGPTGAESGSQSGSVVVPSSFQTFINIVSEPSRTLDSVHPSSSRPTGESLKSSHNTQPQAQTPWTMPQAPAPLKPELPQTEPSRPESVAQFQATNFGAENIEQSNFGSSTQERQRTSGSRPRDPLPASPQNSDQRKNSASVSNEFLAPATNIFPSQSSSQFPAPASEQLSETEQHQLTNSNTLNKFQGAASSQSSGFRQNQFNTPVQLQSTGNFMGTREQEHVRSVPSSEELLNPPNSQFQAPENSQFERFQPKPLQENSQRQPDIQVNVQGQPVVAPQGQFNWQSSSLEKVPAQVQSQLVTPFQEQVSASSKSRLPAQSSGQFTENLKEQLRVVSQGQLPASFQGRLPVRPQRQFTGPSQVESNESSQGQFVALSKARFPAQFQGQFSSPSQGQFKAPSQEQFASPPQGHFSAPSQGQFASHSQGQFSATSQEQFASPPQGQFSAPSKGQFLSPSQSQFSAPSQGQFTSPRQGQLTLPSQGHFPAVSHEQFSAPPKGQFVPPSQGQFSAPSNGQFSAPSQGQFPTPPNGQFAKPPPGQFSAHSQGILVPPSQGQLAPPSQGHFAGPSRGQFQAPSQGQFPAPSQAQFAAPSRGQFSTLSQGQGQLLAPSQGQFASPPRGRPLTQPQRPTQPRPQPRPNLQSQFQSNPQNQFTQFSQERPKSQNPQNLAPRNPPQAPTQFLNQKPQVDISFNPNEFNPQFQPRQPIPFKSQSSSNEQPEYLREYENHQFFTQQILSQLQNTVRKARAANLTDSELEVLLELDKEMRANSSGLTDTEVRSEITALSRSLGLELEEAEPAALPVPEVKPSQDNSTNVTTSVEAVAVNLTLSPSKNETQIPEEVVSTETTVPAEDNPKAEVKSETGDFRAPKTIQRGFFPILPYSEDDPGLLLVSMKTNPRSSRALAFPAPEKVYVSLTRSS